MSTDLKPLTRDDTEHGKEYFEAEAVRAEVAAAFERGRQQGMVQERALWQLAESTQEIEAIGVLRAELEQARHMLAEEQGDFETVMNKAAAMREELEKAREDARMLDWLETMRVAVGTDAFHSKYLFTASAHERGHGIGSLTLREEIRAAMSTDQAERKPSGAHCTVCNSAYGSCGHCG